MEIVNNKWITNLSNILIPIEAQLLLQLGDRFNLPNNNFKLTTYDFIKCLENNTSRLTIETNNSILNNSIPIIQKLNATQHNINDKLLLQWTKITNQFLHNNSNIIVTRADKGNVTVILDKQEYINNMETYYIL